DHHQLGDGDPADRHPDPHRAGVRRTQAPGVEGVHHAGADPALVGRQPRHRHRGRGGPAGRRALAARAGHRRRRRGRLPRGVPRGPAVRPAGQHGDLRGRAGGRRQRGHQHLHRDRRPDPAHPALRVRLPGGPGRGHRLGHGGRHAVLVRRAGEGGHFAGL
ncbi:MAG: Ligand-binding SRPBCC domain protein family, partial [uncultured Corynebacteriales bacterium]